MEPEDLIKTEEELNEYKGPDQIRSSVWLRGKINEKEEAPKLLTGIPTLDKILEGLEGGELVVVSGPTGGGKTTLCQSVTRNMSDMKNWSLWFSYEVQPRNFFKQFGSELPMFFLPEKLLGNTLQWLEKRIWEAKLKTDIKVVFIDHLHFIVDMAVKQNMSLQIGEVVRGIKKIALKHNLVIFLIAHMFKTQPEHEPGLGDVRDSSFIEQEADTVLYMWRKQKIDNEGVLKIAKNRRTGFVNRKIQMVHVSGRGLQEKA